MGRATARLFDAMAEEYDVLEPWYEHLYAVLHRIVLDVLAIDRHGGPSHGPPKPRFRSLKVSARRPSAAHLALPRSSRPGKAEALLDHRGHPICP